MNKTSTIKYIENKQKELQNISLKLKNDFVGLDEIIDRIIESIEIWYIFPQLQLRPTILCLWGLTGVGKTDLIRKMVRYMSMQDKCLEIEMGPTSINNGSKLKDELEYSSLDPNDQCILFLDEFQKFRTIDETGQSTQNTTYPDIWSLLSDGKFHSSTSKKRDLIDYILSVKFNLQEDEIENQRTKTVGKARKIQNIKKVYNIDAYFARKIKKTFNLGDSLEDIMKWEDSKILSLYEAELNNKESYEGISYNKMLIIISGNLDEAFRISKDVSQVDVDADIYHEISKKINIINIKSSLSKRFAPEQIARLGNTHVIYPSLSKDNYKKIIKSKCKEIFDKVLKEENIKIEPDDSIYELMYSNGVFPTQGVRPLISTITNILSATLPKFIYNCLLENQNEFSIRTNKNIMIGTIGGEQIEIEVPTVVDSIRENVDGNKQYLCAIHEIGHILIYCILSRIVPQQVCFKSVHEMEGGFMATRTGIENKKIILDNIKISMGGRLAEIAVFGESVLSDGIHKDLQMATGFVYSYICDYGFHNTIGTYVQSGDDGSNGKILDPEIMKNNAEIILKEQLKEATIIFNTNINLFRDLVSIFTKNKDITSSDLILTFKKYNYILEMSTDQNSNSVDYKELAYKFLLS